MEGIKYPTGWINKAGFMDKDRGFYEISKETIIEKMN